MTQTTDFGSHSVLELLISKEGKLGIEFRSTVSPYFVINVSTESQGLYGVQPGDLLLAVKSNTDTEWTDADGLEWSSLVDVLKSRPAVARFKRFKMQSHGSPTTTEPAVAQDLHPELEAKPALFYHPSPKVRGDASPKNLQPIKSPFNKVSSSPRSEKLGTSSPVLVRPSPISPASAAPPHSPATAPLSTARADPVSEISVVYTVEGPLGLEFEEMDFPFRVGGVRAGSMSVDKGVRRGDSLLTVNGRATKGMIWDEIRTELSKRPAHVVFLRDPFFEAKDSSQSIWDVAAGLMRGGSTPDPLDEIRRERDELRHIVSTVGAEDLIVLRQVAREYEYLKSSYSQIEGQIETLRQERDSAASLMEEERSKNMKLVEVIEEIEKSQSAIIERFEKEIKERERLISELKTTQRDRSESSLTAGETTAKLEAASEALKETEAKLELIEKDNSRLRKENMDLGSMVQQCLEKIQRDLSDKPHWVDRRVVCSAIGTLLRDVDKIDDSTATAVDAHMSARQKLGDVLGMTYEERTAVGLLSVPARFMVDSGSPDKSQRPRLGEDFVTFLERETNQQV